MLQGSRQKHSPPQEQVGRGGRGGVGWVAGWAGGLVGWLVGWWAGGLAGRHVGIWEGTLISTISIKEFSEDASDLAGLEF